MKLLYIKCSLFVLMKIYT